MAMRKVPEDIVGSYSWDIYSHNEMEDVLNLQKPEEQWVMTGIQVVVTPLGLIITHEKQKWIPRDSQKYGVRYS